MHLTGVLDLSRAQFAMTALFHIMWPILTISLSAFLVLIEVLWLRTDNIHYYRQARFWSKLLVLNFAVGVVSGIPMDSSSATSSASKARWPSCSKRVSSA
jgi:cytochrome d ubiquinol oxidase subunit I